MNAPREEPAAEDELSPESPLSKWTVEYRDRLRNLIDREMDQRLRLRVDASDIVQETFATANRMLPDYLRDQPLPVYQWLR
jgi:DNA-directed RNA polymerase specialized sigma24 family protein